MFPISMVEAKQQSGTVVRRELEGNYRFKSRRIGHTFANDRRCPSLGDGCDVIITETPLLNVSKGSLNNYSRNVIVEQVRVNCIGRNPTR